MMKMERKSHITENKAIILILCMFFHFFSPQTHFASKQGIYVM